MTMTNDGFCLRWEGRTVIEMSHTLPLGSYTEKGRRIWTYEGTPLPEALQLGLNSLDLSAPQSVEYKTPLVDMGSERFDIERYGEVSEGGMFKFQVVKLKPVMAEAA